MGKLLLNRDFTRFLEEDDFPHRVEVHFGEKKLICSGMVLAQQSAVIEKLIRADCGILMFEKIENIGTVDQKIDCIKFMYGANLELNIKNIDTAIKFASFYSVEDLFTKSIKWVEKNLSARNMFMFADISSSLEPGEHYTKFQSALNRFINKNVDATGQELAERLLHGDPIDPSLFMSILKHSPSNGSILLQEWAEKSSENKALILKNAKGLNFIELFPTQETFTSFIACISSGLDLDSMKQVLALQQDYFIKGAEKAHEQATSSQKQPELEDEEVKLSETNETESVTSDTKSTPSMPGAKKNRQHSSSHGGQNRKKNVGDKANDKKDQWVPSDNKNTNKQKNVPPTINNQKNKLFIGNVPSAATVNDIRKPFMFAGPILKIDILGGKNIAFVEFKTVQSAKQILDKASSGFKFKILNQFIHVAECKPRTNNPSATKPRTNNPSTTTTTTTTTQYL